MYATSELEYLRESASFGLTDSYTRTKKPKNEVFYRYWQQKNSGLVTKLGSAPLTDCLVDAMIKIDPPTRVADSFTFSDAKDLWGDCVVGTFSPEGVDGPSFRLWAAVQVVHQVGSKATGWLEGVHATARDDFGRYLRLKANLKQCQYLEYTSPTEGGVILFAYLAVKVPLSLLHLLFGKDEKSSEHYVIDDVNHGILPLWGPTLETEPSDNTTSLEVIAPDEAQLKRRLQAVHSLLALWHEHKEGDVTAVGALRAELESVQQLFYLMNRAPSPKALKKARAENKKDIEAQTRCLALCSKMPDTVEQLTDVLRSLNKKRSLLELHSAQSVKLHQVWFGEKAVQHQGSTGKKSTGWDLGIVVACTTNHSDMWCADDQQVPLQWNYDSKQDCVEALDRQSRLDADRILNHTSGILMKCCCQLCSSTGESSGVSLYFNPPEQQSTKSRMKTSVKRKQRHPRDYLIDDERHKPSASIPSCGVGSQES